MMSRGGIEKTEEVARLFIDVYPGYEFLFSGVTHPKRIAKSSVAIPEAIVRIVAGQMLSRHAAKTIYQRCVERAVASRLLGTWQLTREELRSCGLSGRKADAIESFSKQYRSIPKLFERWWELDPSELNREVCNQKGMSDWTASMLSIFYLGHEDVFPSRDASIKKAMVLAHQKSNSAKVIDPDAAKPFRSYLALYLWQALDSGELRQH